MWTFIRFLHLTGVVFFVGGQLMLVVAVTPVLRAAGDEATMRSVAKRFGIGSAVALVVLLVTGAAMASHYDVWSDSVLQAKLGLLVLIGVLSGLHVVSAQTRLISLSLVAISLVIVYLGVKLTFG
jgi:uncharacterized membrane protein